jgi:hypothetical protein
MWNSLMAAVGTFSGPIVPETAQKCAAGWGSLVQVIGNLIQFAIYLGIAIAVLMIAYAGFMWVLNPINPENRSSARKLLMNAAIGLVLTLAAWLIVNTLLNILGAGGVGGATSFLSGGNPCIIPVASGPGVANGTGGGIVAVSPSNANDCPGALICTAGKCVSDPEVDNGDGLQGQPCNHDNPVCAAGLTCDATDTCNPIGSTPAEIPATCSASQPTQTLQAGTPQAFADYFSFDSNSERAEIPAASPALTSLLNCMAGTLQQAGYAAHTVGRISAITDSRVLTDTTKIKQCAANGSQKLSMCVHTVNSCHYGGYGSCSGLSYAVDFGDQQNADALRAAGRACDPSAKWNPAEAGTHVHVSVGADNGCGCDTRLSSI